MNNAQFRKNQYIQEYGMATPTSPRDNPAKFQRKQENKVRIESVSKDRKKKIQEESQDNKELCYISTTNNNETLKRVIRSNSFNPGHRRVQSCKNLE